MAEGIANQFLQNAEDMFFNLLGQFRHILLKTNLEIALVLKLF